MEFFFGVRWQYPVGRRLSTAIPTALSLFTQIGCHWQTIWQLRTSWPWWSTALEARSGGMATGCSQKRWCNAYASGLPVGHASVDRRLAHGAYAQYAFCQQVSLEPCATRPTQGCATEGSPRRHQHRRHLPSHLHTLRHSPLSLLLAANSAHAPDAKASVSGGGDFVFHRIGPSDSALLSGCFQGESLEGSSQRDCSLPAAILRRNSSGNMGVVLRKFHRNACTRILSIICNSFCLLFCVFLS